MLAIHRKSTNICMHTWTVSLRSYTLSSSAHTLPSVTNSSAVRWSAVRSFFNTFLCKKRWVHHNRHQLVELCQSLEPQGVLRHWQAQSAHVSIPTVVGFFVVFWTSVFMRTLGDSSMPACFRGPVNEDVFAAPAFHGGKIIDSDIQEISEQIHRLLLQVCTHTVHFYTHKRHLTAPLTATLSAAGPQYGLQWLW